MFDGQNHFKPIKFPLFLPGFPSLPIPWRPVVPGAQGPSAQHLPLHLPGTRSQLLRRGRVHLAALEELLHVVHGETDEGRRRTTETTVRGPQRI